MAALAAAALVLLLSACATVPAGPAEAPPPETPLLAQLEARLPGRYVSVRGGDQPLQRLLVERVGAEPGRELELRLTQRSDDQPPRVFGLRLSATPIDSRLRGQLALLGTDGESRRSCAMTFQAADTGLVGETDAAQCVFGEDAEAVGLLKEMAFDGSRLTIGDRLVDPASGQPRGEDRIITFLPQPVFDAWAGRRDGDAWRVARSFTLRPGGGQTAPLDAAQMPLGFDVSLDYYRMDRTSDTVLLRLTVLDSESGQRLGEAWAAPQSQRIGVALPDIQVGLDRDGQNERR